MNRTMQTDLEAEVRVVGQPDGSVDLACISTNQHTWVTLNDNERKQLIAWLRHPCRPVVSPEVL